MNRRRDARGPDLVRDRVAFGDEELPAPRTVVPVLGRPARRVALLVQVAAPLRQVGLVHGGTWPRLAEVGEFAAVAGPAVGTGDENHGFAPVPGAGQCPTAAAPRSPTRRPSGKRARSKAAMSSGVLPVAASSAIASPAAGPALNP